MSSNSDSFWTLCKPLLRKLARAAWSGFRRGLREVKETAFYYLSHRTGLFLLFREYAPFFKEHGTRREIWAPKDEPLKSIEYDEHRWRVELPDCCAVCGERTNEPWLDEERTIPDLTWPLWMPIIGLIIGLLLPLYLEGRWYLVAAPAAGFWLGYRLRSEADVRIRYRRCAQHSKRKRIPHVRLAKGHLVVDVGHRSVYRQFRELEEGIGSRDDEVDDHNDYVRERPGYVPLPPPLEFDDTPLPLAGGDDNNSSSASAPSTSTPDAALSPRDEDDRERTLPLADEANSSAEPDAGHNRHT